MTQKVARYATLLLLLLAFGVGAQARASDISGVSVSRPFFNPSLRQTVSLSFTLGHGGTLTVLILDRDGYLVRRLVSDKQAGQGSQTFQWDGRDDSGEIVPDEAYSLKIDLVGSEGVATYFPGNASAGEVKVQTKYYDRRTGVASYVLPRPARVHIQAGIARTNPKTKRSEGPVLKTIANREPRPGGAVVENWNGFDESGTFYVPDLPNFVMAVAATTLPENSILTNGNRALTFLERASRRTGQSLFAHKVKDHTHHSGLLALEDVAPSLKAVPANATWSTSERVWSANGNKLAVALTLGGPSATAFAREPGTLMVFVDLKRVREVPNPSSGRTVHVPLSGLSPGTHIVAFDWVSRYGPVAVQALRVKVQPREALAELSAR